MAYIEDQPQATTEVALITRFSLWIDRFEPAGKLFLAFDKEKCQHNGELMAVLSSPVCSIDLMHAYSNQLTKADRLGYFPFNLEQEDGTELNDRDFILLSDREKHRVIQGR
ncbi:hypothetical protein [Pseudoxanthomonas sp. GM95]|uniref:hypothetical protein n=1 Tax=Pseudoxanthomonas sp. GM95 TaxID=1881043 RepID=UPI0011144360|nr:hypothetical protein [Pseudoxanthomonas sp. GM95]